MPGPLPPELGAFFAACPPGQQVWLRGAGRSLYPLLRSGDAILAVRCGAEQLARGDIALLLRRGQLTAHVVLECRPLRTASLLGAEDPEGGVPLGRILALRRGSWRIPLPTLGRPLLWLGQRAVSAAWSRPAVRASYRRLRDIAFSRWSRPLRQRWLGPLEIRLLRADDLDAMLVFAGERLEVPSRHLRHQLVTRWARGEQPEGAAVGAFDVRGHLRGFAFLDDYHQEGLRLEGLWVRSLVVAPQARTLGVASRLVIRLLEAARLQGAARVFADVEESNAASLRVFQRTGFRPAPPELTERLNAEGFAAGRRKRLIALECSLEEPTPLLHWPEG